MAKPRRVIRLQYKAPTPAIFTNQNNAVASICKKRKSFFILKVIDAEIEFVKDNNNNVIELIVHFKGQNQVAKKVK
jgi:hypothetical protein